MRVADLIPLDQERWLRQLLQKHGDEVSRLYLIYDDTQYGPDKARDLWCEVVPEDFVAQEQTDILSNERLKTETQQGITRPFSPVLPPHDRQWWLEVYLDRDLWELPEFQLKEPSKKRR